MKTSQLRAIIREELFNELHENENTAMYSSPQQQQSEMDKLLQQAEELRKLRDELTRQIDQLEVVANTFNVNEDAAANKSALDAKRTAIDKEISALNKQKQELSKPGTTLEESEQLNEMPFIGGEKGGELEKAIQSATANIKEKFPTATASDISKIILSKKKRPELAPEVEAALEDQEEKYGDDPKYNPTLGGPQTLRAVEKALGEREVGQRGRKAGEAKKEKPTTEPKAKTEKPAKTKTEKPTVEPKAQTEKPAEKKKEETKPVTKPFSKPEVDKEDAAATKMASKVKGSGLNKAEKYAKLNQEFNRIDTELRSLAKDNSPETMAKRRALSGDKIRIEMAMAKLKQIK